MKEVTDFGFDLINKQIDGFITCNTCNEEIHFVIKQKDLKELIEYYKKMGCEK